MHQRVMLQGEGSAGICSPPQRRVGQTPSAQKWTALIGIRSNDAG